MSHNLDDMSLDIVQCAINLRIGLKRMILFQQRLMSTADVVPAETRMGLEGSNWASIEALQQVRGTDLAVVEMSCGLRLDGDVLRLLSPCPSSVPSTCEG